MGKRLFFKTVNGHDKTSIFFDCIARIQQIQSYNKENSCGSAAYVVFAEKADRLEVVHFSYKHWPNAGSAFESEMMAISKASLKVQELICVHQKRACTCTFISQGTHGFFGFMLYDFLLGVFT